MVRANSYIGKRRSLTNEQIVELYGELQDADLVGYRAGCSGTTVLSIVRAAGQPVAPRGGRTGRRIFPTLPDNQIIELYKAGLTATEVACRAGCSPEMVYRILAANGVERRRGALGLRRRYREPG